MKQFMNENFLLDTPAAERLYHEYAAGMPIYDFHCHLPVHEIAGNRRFSNISQIWLAGDHYKWRAMRAAGIPEADITGDADDRTTFDAWAKTIPTTLGNPLYHWTHLELQRFFKIHDLLSPGTADAIWEKTKEHLQTDEFSVRRLLARSNVRTLCSTDDPIDSLKDHKTLAEDPAIETKVLPTFRPDKALNFNDTAALNEYLDRLGEAADLTISDYASYIEALDRRHAYFHAAGCRLADHALLIPVCRTAAEAVLKAAFDKVRGGADLSAEEAEMLQTAGLLEIARMHAKRGWVMQLHISALRNGNSRMYSKLGPDTGFDSIASGDIITPLAKILDALEKTGELPKTIVYPLNPADYYPVTTLLGSFGECGVPGKMQLGSAWWFMDQLEGMEYHMKVLSSVGLLSRFVGMLTDSRSFLSYPRHEYFRRILANYLGSRMENGEIPADFALVGGMVGDICYNNIASFIID